MRPMLFRLEPSFWSSFSSSSQWVRIWNAFSNGDTFFDPLLLPAERLIHRLIGIDPKCQMDWKRYSLAFGVFSMVNVVVLYFALRWQAWFPWFFPKVLTTPMTPDLAANTAVSFATTTTWQAYPGENTMSYFSQLLLAGQNFLAGAAGLAVGIAFIRGYAREKSAGLGNFWSDLVRGILWVLLPVSLLGGVLLIAQGVPMNFLPYSIAQTVEGGRQTIAQGVLSWSSSRTWAPTAAVFLTSTLRIHSRIRRH